MDFEQDCITSIHDFGYDRDRTRELLEEFCQERPTNLVLPLLWGETEQRTVPGILSELNKATFLNCVTVALYAQSKEEFESVVRFFRRRLEIPHRIMWCNGPGVNAILKDLGEEGIDVVSFQGKGRDVWLALGVASIDSYAIILHDADIVNYTCDLPMKLAYPLVDPKLDYFFNKGYYARIGGDPPKFYGRNTRLFVQPLLEALSMKMDCSSDFLQYISSFKYPLSGEIALTSDLARNIRIPTNWGLEVGTLYQVYRSAVNKRICQTDLGFFEHEHREVGSDRSEGLLKMAGDILITLFEALLVEEQRLEISSEFLQALRVMYRRKAQDSIRKYYADSVFNQLSYNRHEEESMVDAFETVIIEAGEEYIKNPQSYHIPDWLRATSAVPKIRRRLIDSVLEDERLVQEG